MSADNAKVLTTQQLNKLLHKCKGQPIRNLDPDGLHIIETLMLHNDNSLRCMFFVKLSEREQPAEFQFDVPLGSLSEFPSLAQFKAAFDKEEA